MTKPRSSLSGEEKLVLKLAHALTMTEATAMLKQALKARQQPEQDHARDQVLPAGLPPGIAAALDSRHYITKGA